MTQPNSNDTVNVLQEEYQRLMHAMQTGVSYTVEGKYDDGSGSPKHLRVGVNSSLMTASALAILLIDKGLITEQEYWEQLVKTARDEVQRYEAIIAEKAGVAVTLL